VSFQVLYNTAIRSRRREQIDQLLYAPEEILPECLERLHGCAHPPIAPVY